MATHTAPAFGRAYLEHWLLDPAFAHLNHGTVGAVPRRVLAVQQALRDEMERNPAYFLLRELAGRHAGQRDMGESRTRRSARDVAAFVGARGDDLVFTDNTTTAANAVLRSLALRPDDEIVLFDHAYGAIRKSAEYVARNVGATVRSIALPFPELSEEQVVQAVERGIGPRTRLAIFDHITAPSALLLPIAAIAAVCRKHAVSLFVDGAHAPGAVPLDLPAIGADFYAGNLHKWAWSPRSCALLWVAPERQAELHPTTISWGLDQGLTKEFDWVGTRDPTPFLAAPAALDFMRELGVERVQQYNHALAWQAGQLLSQRWGSRITVPESMVGSMILARLPAAAGTSQEQADKLRDVLLFEHKIEVPLIALAGGVWARVSAQIYNDLSDIERLAQAVTQSLA
jgi:isopenicillin-N epimerase